jgi:hypothetical protein
VLTPVSRVSRERGATSLTSCPVARVKRAAHGCASSCARALRRPPAECCRRRERCPSSCSRRSGRGRTCQRSVVDERDEGCGSCGACAHAHQAHVELGRQRQA